MDSRTPEDTGAEAPKGPGDWIEEFRRQCKAVKHAADEWAVRWHEPEGRFISALLTAMQTFSRLAVSAQATIEAATQEGRASARTDLERVRELARSAEIVLAQARTAQYHLHLSQQTLVDQLVNDTLPLFAQQMKEVLVIRERRWNQDKGFQRMALAGVFAIVVFLSGFVVRTWVDWDELGVVERCALHTSVEGGHVVCDLTASASP
jgi:hypothetical protein